MQHQPSVVLRDTRGALNQLEGLRSVQPPVGGRRRPCEGAHFRASFHDLRHTLATQLAANGVPLRVIQARYWAASAASRRVTSAASSERLRMSSFA